MNRHSRRCCDICCVRVSLAGAAEESVVGRLSRRVVAGGFPRHELLNNHRTAYDNDGALLIALYRYDRKVCNAHVYNCEESTVVIGHRRGFCPVVIVDVFVFNEGRGTLYVDMFDFDEKTKLASNNLKNRRHLHNEQPSFCVTYFNNRPNDSQRICNRVFIFPYSCSEHTTFTFRCEKISFFAGRLRMPASKFVSVIYRTFSVYILHALSISIL